MQRTARAIFLLAAVAIASGCGGGGDRGAKDHRPEADSADPASIPAASGSGAGSGAALTAAHDAPSGVLRYVAEGDSSVTLTLTVVPGGGVTGTLSEGSRSMSLAGRRHGDGYTGTVGSGSDEVTPFSAAESGDRIVLEIGDPGEGERLTLRRAGTATAATKR